GRACHERSAPRGADGCDSARGGASRSRRGRGHARRAGGRALGDARRDRGDPRGRRGTPRGDTRARTRRHGDQCHGTQAGRRDPAMLRAAELLPPSGDGTRARHRAAHPQASRLGARRRPPARSGGVSRAPLGHAELCLSRRVRHDRALGQEDRSRRCRAPRREERMMMPARLSHLMREVVEGRRLAADECLALAECAALPALMAAAAALRDEAHGRRVSYSRKVFIPLTRLCRDVCHYCTFARAPRRGERAYLTREEVLAIARAGAAAGCKEALFTLGDKPELRYAVARAELTALGHASTISYLVESARLVFAETGLLPHANPGVLGAEEIAALRAVSVSQGLMLESSAERLCRRGGPHFGSPDKHPAR